MNLDEKQLELLNGKGGKAAQKAMQILHTLGNIYQAACMVPVRSVQIAGVSYANLGEAGLDFLQQMADGGAKVRVLTTLNPAGMDIENWQKLGISEDFAHNQIRVIEAFESMGVTTTCTCTPYLSGNLPAYRQHIAWAESSAVCFANSVLGARTNREGGPSALASAITGVTPKYGMHLDENRKPTFHFQVDANIDGSQQFGALGKVIGEKIEALNERVIPLISGIEMASIEELKSFCASIATYGGIPLFHMQGITPEAELYSIPARSETIIQSEIDLAVQSLNEPMDEEVDFVSLGCPHLSIHEISRIAELLEGKKVNREFWITTSRPTKMISDMMGYTNLIEESGAKFAVDTCCVVAPIKGRFNVLATDSAKACYYAYSKNNFKTVFLPFEDVVAEALK
ncbi:MAG: aconitase X catalytic domain-containing protein [Anaerolineaceae bacterium]|nr:aconitase X catalytic domain-containing protein [Anaerolineaceae bacterium]